MISFADYDFSLLDGVLRTVSTVNPLEGFNPSLTYRIVLYNPYDKTYYVIAVSGITKFQSVELITTETEKTIRKHWKYLLEQIIPQINSLKDRKSDLKSSKDDSETQDQQETPDEEVIQFILSKVNSLAHVIIITIFSNIVA